MENYIGISDKALQAIKDGELQYCPNCGKVQPFELTKLNPDLDEEPNLIACLICGEGIDLIENL